MRVCQAPNNKSLRITFAVCQALLQLLYRDELTPHLCISFYTWRNQGAESLRTAHQSPLALNSSPMLSISHFQWKKCFQQLLNRCMGVKSHMEKREVGFDSKTNKKNWTEWNAEARPKLRDPTILRCLGV